MRPRFPVVFFDLDGALLRGTTVSLMTAESLGWLTRGDRLVVEAPFGLDDPA